MGIKGIYNEIGPGQRIALSKLAIQTFEEKGRPLRLAIDISIWLFQIQSGKGGTNPALRTFFYRLLRLISLSIHPLFVFDGPNKPPFKRHKRTGPNVASIPEFLAKQLLKQFGLPFHQAPGEAEAECALLQCKGIVDAVLSEDVDTLMFGSGMTLRNWSCMDSSKSNKAPTHVNVYHAQRTKQTSGLDREGMILVAVMSGGDYIPEGIPGCGPKTACEAARAGFGAELCALTRNDKDAFLTRLKHELSTNESNFFSRKHKALVIPEDFPRFEVLKYYTHPVVSSDDRLEILQSSIKWDANFDLPALRTFTIEAFNWVCISGAKHFVRNLAPPLLIRSLRLNDRQEDQIIKHIYGKRNHPINDDAPEMRVGYVPLELVPIDLEAEEPDPEDQSCEVDSDEEALVELGEDGAPLSPKKKRVQIKFDPSTVDRIWLMETLVRRGSPQKLGAWENSFQAVRAAAKKAGQASKQRQAKKKPDTSMPHGALDAFTRTTKPGLVRKPVDKKDQPEQVAVLNITEHETRPELRPVSQPSLMHQPCMGAERKKSRFRAPPSFPTSTPSSTSTPRAAKHTIIDLLSSPETKPVPRKKPLRRSLTDQPLASEPLHGSLSVDDDGLQKQDAPSGRSQFTLRKTTSAIDLEPQAGTSGTERTNMQAKLRATFDPAASKVYGVEIPRTPSKRVGGRNAITISSQTPTSRQKSIREFLSPRSGNIEAGTPTKQKVPVELDAIDMTTSDETDFGLREVTPRSPLHKASTPRKNAPSLTVASETLRIRTSLAGGFALEQQQQQTYSCTSRLDHPETTRARTWQMSRVDMIDLTDE